MDKIESHQERGGRQSVSEIQDWLFSLRVDCGNWFPAVIQWRREAWYIASLLASQDDLSFTFFLPFYLIYGSFSFHISIHLL